MPSVVKADIDLKRLTARLEAALFQNAALKALRHPESSFAGDADPFFHLVEIFGEGAAAGCGQAIFGARDAAFEKFYAGNVLGFFEFAGVNAEIAVGGLEHALEVVEAEGIVGSEGADDAQADALVNQSIKLGEFGSDGRSVFPNLLASWFAMLFPTLRFGLDRLAMGWKWSSHRGASR